MKIPSDTVQAAQRLLAEREAVGLAKYGTTVDRTDLQAGDWLQHAIEEASDLLLYLIRLQQKWRQDSEFFAKFVTSDFQPADSGPVSEQPPHDPIAEGFRRKAEHAKYLARWANAPAEATHLSEDSTGIADWWTKQPLLERDSDGHQGWVGAGWLDAAPTSILGRVACEPRPEVQS